ncbi:hypothetical protein [Pseudoxanthomonas sp. PXM04]|uniref:hypothetical protein n=1 Tax=Pseudoxanthomonas sp. PXM04 TaxID=2769297 RepID=UPI001786F1ED|nr:hypothetical protein [Pseudoxanthomonas sp. PXM04]MBD9378928.1 hypothetical protein [Pseudoxanthomonas sp. PXM04]
MHREDSRVSGWPRVGLGALVAGMADLVFAMGFWWISHGVPPMRILQSIAAGWYGEASFTGGVQTAGVGAVSHFAIMFLFVAAYRQMATRVTLLRQRPFAMGAVYGLFLYLLMNFVVLPLSAAGMASFKDAGWVAASVAIHALIGVLCARYALAPGAPGDAGLAHGRA